MNNDTRNIIMAVTLSTLVLFGYDYFFHAKDIPTDTLDDQNTSSLSSQGHVSSTSVAQDTGDTVAPPPGGPHADSAKQDSPVVYPSKSAYLAHNASSLIGLSTPSLKGSLNLVGGSLNDVTLTKYRVSLSPDSPKVDLLMPAGTLNPYYITFEWSSPDGSVTPPNNRTVWTASVPQLTSEQPLTLSYTNEQGVTFKRTFSVDENYMFTIVEDVTNPTDHPIALVPSTQIIQGGATLKASDYMAYYVGPLGVMNGTLREVSYEDLATQTIREIAPPPGEAATQGSTPPGGWIGFTDRYWLTALIPDQSTPHTYEFKKLPSVTTPGDGLAPSTLTSVYRVSTTGQPVVVAPGKTFTQTSHLFAGAKVVSLLDGYEETLNVPKFDRAVDFGWFYIITKPLFYTLMFLHSYISNMGVCILILTVLIKLIFLPLANKSYKSMARMKTLQPKMQALQEKYADDKMKLNQEVMALYKREKVNPVSGCLPMLIQVPFFFGLYKVLFISIEMRQAPFFGWVHDLSLPDPTSVFTLFGYLPWDPPSFLVIGIWPLILGATMFLQQKMSPQPADPTQAKVMMVLPIVFTFMFAQFPVGLVIYWAWNNVLSIGQQWFITHLAEKANSPKTSAKAAERGRASSEGKPASGAEPSPAGEGEASPEKENAPQEATPPRRPSAPPKKKGPKRRSKK